MIDTNYLQEISGAIDAAIEEATNSPELNMSNYTEDEVSELNNAMINIYTILTSLQKRTNPPPCSRACESKSYEITIRGLRADLMRAASKLSLEVGGGDISNASDRNLYSIIQELEISAKEK